jgi:divalent metal cation (Fe/Co/Zn/Cd) transporter
VTPANRVTDWIAKRGMRSTLLGILVNLGLSVTKISAGFVGHSFALVADGLESGADVLGGLVVFSV